MPEDRFERLANLVTVLLDAGERGHGGTSYAEIVAALPGYPESEEARRRAFERDKKLLRDEDIPLVEENGRYWIPPEEYYLPDLALSDDEHLALQLAVAAVPVAGGQGGAALQKLTFGRGSGEGIAAAAPLADLDDHPLLPLLHSAIRQRAAVSFTHRGAERTVEPALLFFRDGNWYLFGFDLLREADRNFRVDRIEGSVELGPASGFERRATAGGATEAMPKEPWLYGGAGEAEDAVVQVDAVLAAKAVADAGASAAVECHDDGSVTIRMPVVQRDPFRSWVFGLLDHAEVVGSPALRDDVAGWLRRMAGMS